MEGTDSLRKIVGETSVDLAEGSDNFSKLEKAKLQETVRVRDERIAMLEEAHDDLIRQIEELSIDAYFDKITDLRSRTFFNNDMEYRMARVSRKEDASVSLILCDLDYFKSINDTFGHFAGDEALKAVAEVLKNSIRGEDIAVRWGGDEVAVVMSDISPENAMVKAREIQKRISEITFADYPNLHVTVSIGVVSSDEIRPLTTSNALFKAADKAAYFSKDKGRDRVTSYSDLPEELKM